MRDVILGLINEATSAGARLRPACNALGIDAATVQRWKKQGVGEDRRAGPKSVPKHKFTERERRKVLEVVNLPEYRDLPVTQIVPQLADRGEYVGSERTIYRILEAENQLKRRDGTKPRIHVRPPEIVATRPNQAWSWDITYVKSPIAGLFYYVYMVIDIWSRKIVGAHVHESECSEHASVLLERICREEEIEPGKVNLHSDNGSPMKGATLLATLQALGVATSFSRPRVSDDNPYSEALFRTLKYRPEYPSKPFQSLEAAAIWVEAFVSWYNTEHRHSAIRFVTPEQRHRGEDHAILARRDEVYRSAKARNPQRWSGDTRCWTPVTEVRLNPSREEVKISAA